MVTSIHLFRPPSLPVPCAMPLPDPIWCFLIGDRDVFPVDINEIHTWWTVTHLKHAIKVKLSNTLATVAADALTLYRVAIDESSCYNGVTYMNEFTRLSHNLKECTELDEKQQVSVIFDERPPPGRMYHILVKPPRVVGSIYLCIYSMYAHSVVSLNAWPQNLQSLIPPPND